MAKRRICSRDETPHKRSRTMENGGDEEEEDDENIVGPSQESFSLTHNELQADSGASDVGIVESITLKNFMCHSLLGPFKFGSNVNFIIGNNGSGKSAVLTALIVALGGTAQATSRGSSLKGFVKNGECSADVSITLRNKGKDAYKPDVYGTAITIDLRITREGLRTYKLKAKSGQIVSTKKEELQFILDNYNIQVNNPVTILTQEMSKHFLHSKGEGDKYKFFMKATQLEQMKEDFVYIKIAKQGINDKLEQHGECLKELKVKKEEKEDRYRSLASLDDMQTKLEELQKQMAWVLVAEMEKDLLPLREKLQSDQQATKKFDEKVEEWKNKVADAELKFKQIHNQLENITARVQELQPQCAQLKAEASQRNNLLKSAEVTVHRCKTNLRDLETDKVQLSSRIDELKLSISQIKGAESQAREDRIQQLQNEMENLAHQDSTLAQQIGQYQQASQHAKDKLSTLKREHDTLQRSISGNSRNLQTMEASRSNRMRRFGEHMPDLLNSIQEAHRRGQFKERPRGPLGYCISLRDPELALPIEICLKGLLQAFTCDNHEDERVLQGLMANLFRVGQRPSIITSSFLQRIHDTSRRGVNHPDYPSVLQALDIEDPVVANCLIDQKTIESILLIKNRTDARRVMQGGNPPRNCIQAFSADGDQIFTNRSYTAEQTRANYLSGDIEEEIRHMQEELDSQRAQASHSQQQIRRVEEDMKQNDSLLRRTLTEQKNTKERVRKLQMDLTELQNVEEPQSEDLKPLEEELQDIIGKIASKQAECVEARTQAAGLKASYDEAEQAYRKHKEQISAVAEEADVIKEDLSKTDQEVVKCKHHKKHYEEKLKTHLSNIQTLKANLDGREQELRTSVEKAMEISPERLEVGRTAKSTAKSLDSEISRLKFKITTQQDQQGDREEIIRQYQEAVQNYKKMAQQMKGLTNFIRTLNHILNERLKVYNDLKRFLSARCKYYFDTLLAQRGYTGSMTFNHEREALAISVQPGKGDKADLSDMRSLSGGERSFSTVCFVLSLWAITEAPFRCLDEFDVYMDMVNRRISMDMMLKIAASQRYKQFIFLTPQSMSSLPESNLIQILRMKDPDRSSNFSPLGQEEAEQH